MVVSIQEDADASSARRRIEAEEIRQWKGIEDGIADVDRWQDRNLLHFHWDQDESKLYSFTPKLQRAMIT